MPLRACGHFRLSATPTSEIPFDNILDRLTGSDPSVTDYVLEVPARCLQCGAEINEKTLVEWDGSDSARTQVRIKQTNHPPGSNF